MSKKEKLIQKLKAQSKSFSYEDAKVLLEYLNFWENNKGKNERFQGNVFERNTRQYHVA